MEHIPNKWISKWYRYHLNVERLQQIIANFNLTRNKNRNQENLNRAREKLEKWTNKISGTRRRTGIHLSPNRVRNAAKRAILQEARRRIREAQRLLRVMSSPRTLALRQTGRMRTPARLTQGHFNNFL